MNQSNTKQAESEKVCGAYLRVADDYGDNHTTFRCQMPRKHLGEHCVTFTPDTKQTVRIHWAVDEGPEAF